MWRQMVMTPTQEKRPLLGVIRKNALYHQLQQAIRTLPTNCSNVGFYLSRDYYIIDGFDISGGEGTGTGVSIHGIFVGAGTGNVVRNNFIHDIGRTVCSTSVYGFTGIFVGTSVVSNLILDNNVIASVGRLRGTNGHSENGCNLTAGNGNLDQNDHGMYASTLNNADFKNNIFYNTINAPFATYNLKCSGITIERTLTNSSSNNLFATSTSKPLCVSLKDNTVNTNPSFVNVSARNYHLSSESVAVDAGVSVGLPFNGSALDIGAFEYMEIPRVISPPKNLRIK